jgi:multidrug resistance efflux pump
MSGFVTAKSTFVGQQVEPGMELFTITDLSRIWIEADFYEYEASLLAPGRKRSLKQQKQAEPDSFAAAGRLEAAMRAT